MALTTACDRDYAEMQSRDLSDMSAEAQRVREEQDKAYLAWDRMMQRLREVV